MVHIDFSVVVPLWSLAREEAALLVTFLGASSDRLDWVVRPVAVGWFSLTGVVNGTLTSIVAICVAELITKGVVKRDNVIGCPLLGTWKVTGTLVVNCDETHWLVSQGIVTGNVETIVASGIE